MSKRALGKGIDALLMGGLDDRTSGESTGKLEVMLVGIDRLHPGEGQPRKAFNEESLAELADSIREQGVLQPILVESGDDGYTIVAGERRYRAALMAGLVEVPVIVRSLTREERLEIGLIENVQREDLTPIEEAEAYRSLMNTFKVSQEEISKRVGKKRSTVANALRLLNLPDEMQRALSTGALTAGHARAILSVQNPSERQLLFKRIGERGLSVREAEAMAEALNRGNRAGRPSQGKHGRARRTSPGLTEIEQRFIDALGTKVTLKGTLQKGQIEISYFSEEDLDRIFELIAPRTT